MDDDETEWLRLKCLRLAKLVAGPEGDPQDILTIAKALFEIATVVRRLRYSPSESAV